MDEKALRKLREKLDKLLAANRNEEAIAVLADLVRAEPTNPRWAHKRGDLFRRLGRTPDAVEAYSLAVDIYAKTGFIARAVAMAKTVLSLDPTRVDVLQRVDPNAAQQLHRQTRPGAVSVRPPVAPQSGHTLQGTGRHPMVLDDDAPAEPARHPMVLEDDVEDDAPAAAPARHPMVLEDDAPAAAAPAPMVVEDDVPVVLPEDEAPPAAAPRARPAPPPPAAARKTGSGGRPLPPPPPAAAIPKRPITLDQLSLPPPAARPPAPPRPPVRAATMELDSLPPPVAAPPPPPAAARKPPPAPKAAPDPSQGSAPLWARDQGSEASPTPARVAAQRRPPSGPLKPRWEPPADEAELFSRALEAAVELSVDPAAAPNETRFSNAPPSPALALSAAEVSPRRAAAADSDADALQPSADLLSRLPLFPLFAEVPPDALAEMIQGTDLLELQDGDYVMRRGDAADALYGIVEGSVAVNVPGSNFALTLAEGDVFGESCLLQDEPRHADVRVHGRLTVLRIPRDVLLQVLRQHPPLAELLLELLTRRLLANTLQSSPLFQEFDAEGRSTLSSLFEVRRAAEGTRLAVAGKRMDGLYISLTGTLLVEAPGQAPRVAAPGSMFGQHTLISQEPAPATITARVNLVVLRLPSATFSQLAMQYPTIVMRLAELSTDAVVSVNL